VCIASTAAGGYRYAQRRFEVGGGARCRGLVARGSRIERWSGLLIYVFKCMCIYILIHIYIHVCVYMCVCVYACMYVYIYVHVFVRMHVCMYMYIHVCVCMYVCIIHMYSFYCGWRLQTRLAKYLSGRGAMV